MKDVKELITKNIENLKTKAKSINLEKIKAFLPKEKPRINIGLDIGSFFVKAVALRIQKDKAELLKFAIKQVSKNSLGDSIKDILSEFNFADKVVNLSIAGQGVVVRSIQMPKMSISEVKNAVRFEAEKHIPFPVDEVFMDCFILKQLPEENKMLVLVAAAKKELVQRHLGLLKRLGLEAKVIDVDSMALTNIYNRLDSKEESVGTDTGTVQPKKAVALLNMGASFCSLCILKNDMPRFVRDIFIGGDDFTKRIVNILNLSQIDAEKIKCNPGSDWEKITGACETILNNLINEIRRSFDYFESDANVAIGSLYLSGGGSCFKGIDEILKNHINVEVKFLDPFIGLEINEGLNTEELKSQSRKLAVAVGAALRR
ncbi:MAG: type IV pilus assembly protein PilM [Candidatus Omnitrophota bacterium]